MSSSKSGGWFDKTHFKGHHDQNDKVNVWQHKKDAKSRWKSLK